MRPDKEGRNGLAKVERGPLREVEHGKRRKVEPII